MTKGSRPDLWGASPVRAALTRKLVDRSGVIEFINKLNQKTGHNYRLPTEAEWEYAARSGGKKVKWSGTSKNSELEEYAWYSINETWQTNPVGQKNPNGLGLYDMSGNVREWCSDWYGEGFYSKSPRNNPEGPKSVNYGLFRGGSWKDRARYCRSSYRGFDVSSLSSNNLGFRLVLPQAIR